MIFKDRTSAGRLLGAELAGRNYPSPHVFGLARGGMVVAGEVAMTLGAPLDALVVRKLGLPSYPELGFGAIAPRDVAELDEMIVRRYRLNINDIKAIKKLEQEELSRRLEAYGVQLPIIGSEETVILVDDGIATGITMLAAIKYLRTFLPTRLVVAAPVCPDTSESQFRGLIDDFVCLDIEEDFDAVGSFYDSFDQVTDAEVVDILGTKSL